MGNKIFISYKFADNAVLHQIIDGKWRYTVRDYVDAIQDKLGEEHVNKGERNNENLSHLAEDTIASKIKDKIYDSSVTLVMMSPNMKEILTPEKDQWIPWEISYSLRLVTRDDRTSQRNAVIAVVIPDSLGSYDYAIKSNNCTSYCSCNTWQTNSFFPIIRSNMFNLKSKDDNKKDCNTSHAVYTGEVSYISLVRWKDFYNDPDKYIATALERRANVEDYDLTIQLQDSLL